VHLVQLRLRPEPLHADVQRLSEALRRSVGIALFACGVRAACFISKLHDPAWAVARFDEEAYLALAQRVASQGWTSIHEPLHLSPLWTATLVALRACMGTAPWVPLVFNQLCGIATLMLAHHVAVQRTDPKSAAIASAVGAFIGPVCFYELTPMPDALVSLSVTASLASHLWLSERVTWRRSAITCGLVAIATLARASAIVLIPFVAATVLRHECDRSTKLRALSVGLLAFALVTAPLALRGVIATGEPQWIASAGAIDLFIGNGAGATGTWRPPPGFRGEETGDLFAFAEDEAQRALGRAATDSEVQIWWVEHTLDDIAESPISWLRVLLTKARFALAATELGDNRDYQSERAFNQALSGPWAFPISFLLALAMAGLALQAGVGQQGSSSRLPLVASAIVLPAATLLGVYVLGRYRIAFVGPWVIAAAHGLSAARAAVASRRFQFAAFLGAITTILAVASFLSAVPRPSAAVLRHARRVDLERAAIEHAPR